MKPKVHWLDYYTEHGELTSDDVFRPGEFHILYVNGTAYTLTTAQGEWIGGILTAEGWDF